MSITQEQYEHYVGQVQEIVIDLIKLDVIVAETIPIYTRKKPNPKSGEADCPITKREKEHFRYVMKSKLGAAKTEEERQSIIDHYKQLFSE